ncbi:MAG: hypothetical protein AVDCRST_MAG20-2611 [uncultured Acidimicrobiales bacterium]|uniref:Uncharacterized protein n=1 Tax=uncultured Acidimicrobiales bacterium TaxID=310071 RepID=A0A6J4IQS3_9ACTN|nr:MAG: hypothetical protein AVDCRST_MAG20-2611 [uncultured Acidimicrobiales bacterium]
MVPPGEPATARIGGTLHLSPAPGGRRRAAVAELDDPRRRSCARAGPPGRGKVVPAASCAVRRHEGYGLDPPGRRLRTTRSPAVRHGGI